MRVCVNHPGLPPRAPSIRSWYNISMIAAAAAAVDSGNFERGSLTLRMGMRMSRWRERERERERERSFKDRRFRSRARGEVRWREHA